MRWLGGLVDLCRLKIPMGVSKNNGTPKMDGENNGKPYEQMDDLGVPLFLETPLLNQVV